jgi:hypothetical protein
VHILLGILIFKGLTARRLYKSFGVKGLIQSVIYFDIKFKACFVSLNIEVYRNFFTGLPTTLEVKEDYPASQSATVAGN